MSYCVNCGVELDASLKECPLCGTPVINPAELAEKGSPSPFPSQKGQVEKVTKKDFAILLSMVLIATGATCGLLNLFVLRATAWSLLIIGGCLILWVLFIPVVICTKLPVYVSLLLDGLSIGIYLYLITFITEGSGWFFGLALPITAWVIFVAEAFTLCVKKLPVTFLTTTLYLFTAIALLCLGLEALIDRYLCGEIRLLWSAIVLTVCVIIDITLITLLSRKRLRNEVRRRLHF